MTDVTHDELALRARDGDAVAMEALLRRIDEDGSIRVAVRRLVIDSQSVEDISQDVLIRVAERLGTWDGRSRFTTWLYAVARNKAIDHIRALRPTEHLPREETEVMMSDQRRLSSLIATRETVRAALEQLPEMYRRPVVLRDIDQLDYDEIARTLDLTEAAVKSRVRRGRAMVADMWAKAQR
jgi:RNA polymerase sigma factor (sigma-70 family)